MPGRDRGGTRVRGRFAAGAAGVAVLLALAALVLAYGDRAFLRPGPFADRATAALHDPAVQTYVADHLTDAVVRSGTGDLVVLRPLVRATAGGVVGGQAFSSLFRRAVLDAHRSVVEGHADTLRVQVADVGVLMAAVLERLAPGPARGVRAERAATVLSWHPDGAVPAAVRTARHLTGAAWLVALLAVLAAAGALWISPRRRRTARMLGAGLAGGGLTVVALVTVGGALVRQAAPEGSAGAVGALWSAFLGGLRVQAFLLAGAGAVCAVAAGWDGSLAPVTSPRGRLLGHAALILAGVAIILEPGAALRVAAVAAGLYLLVRGVSGVLGVVAGASPRGGQRLRLVPAGLAVVALGVAGAVLATGGGDEAPPPVAIECNGHVALCDRPLNDVALAATHNSYGSVTLPHFLFGQQDGTIADQLRYGVRGLLIDTYHGTAFGREVRTDLERLPKLDVARRELGAPAVDAALRIRSRLGSRSGGRPGIFLCHGFCEVGAVPLPSALADLRTFLVSHPGEVVVVVNQDEGVSPADIERAFSGAGLLDLVYRGPPGPFPTLREMVDSGRRLVVLAENDAGTVRWYHLAYARALQETPFGFRKPAQLTDPAKLAASCRPNRGTGSAPLFLLNHWIDTPPVPRPSLAAVVNAREPLLARAEACRRIRRRIPNLVAVDFYRRGDLLGVVDALNGVGHTVTRSG